MSASPPKPKRQKCVPRMEILKSEPNVENDIEAFNSIEHEREMLLNRLHPAGDNVLSSSVGFPPRPVSPSPEDWAPKIPVALRGSVVELPAHPVCRLHRNAGVFRLSNGECYVEDFIGHLMHVKCSDCGTFDLNPSLTVPDPSPVETEDEIEYLFTVTPSEESNFSCSTPSTDGVYDGEENTPYPTNPVK